MAAAPPAAVPDPPKDPWDHDQATKIFDGESLSSRMLKGNDVQHAKALETGRLRNPVVQHSPSNSGERHSTAGSDPTSDPAAHAGGARARGRPAGLLLSAAAITAVSVLGTLLVAGKVNVSIQLGAARAPIWNTALSGRADSCVDPLSEFVCLRALGGHQERLRTKRESVCVSQKEGKKCLRIQCSMSVSVSKCHIHIYIYIPTHTHTLTYIHTHTCIYIYNTYISVWNVPGS